MEPKFRLMELPTPVECDPREPQIYVCLVDGLSTKYGLKDKTESRNGHILILLGIFCLFSYASTPSHQIYRV